MTLRVIVEIVPFGVEEDKKELAVLDISNTLVEHKDTNFYVYTVKKHGDNYTVKIGEVIHKRSDGFWPLVEQAIQLVRAVENDDDQKSD